LRKNSVNAAALRGIDRSMDQRSEKTAEKPKAAAAIRTGKQRKI